LRRKLLAEMCTEFNAEKAYILKRAGERGRRASQLATPYEVLAEKAQQTDPSRIVE